MSGVASAASAAAVEQTVQVGINWAKVKFITPGFLPLELIYQCGKLVGRVELLSKIVGQLRDLNATDFSRQKTEFDQLMKEKDMLRDAAILGTMIKTMVYVTALLILPLSSVAVVGLTLKAMAIVDLTMHFGSTAFALYQSWSLPVIDFTPPQQAAAE